MWRACTPVRLRVEPCSPAGASRDALAGSERSSRMSVGPSPSQDGPERLQQDVEIQRQRPILDVELIQLDRLLRGHPAAAIDLPPAGDPSQHLVSWAEQFEVRSDLVGGQGARADEAHLPLEDVPELRQLIEAEAPKDTANPCQAGIGLELEEGSRGVHRAVDVQPHRRYASSRPASWSAGPY